MMFRTLQFPSKGQEFLSRQLQMFLVSNLMDLVCQSKLYCGLRLWFLRSHTTVAQLKCVPVEDFVERVGFGKM